MFKKILIANRGEIAVRVIRACREMGITAVAVYSEADRDALHVRLAEEARPIGPPAPASRLFDPQDHRSCERVGRRSDPSRLRIPFGKPAPARGLREGRHRVHRTRRGGDAPDGEQGHRARGDDGGRRSRDARHRHPARGPREGAGHRREGGGRGDGEGSGGGGPQRRAGEEEQKESAKGGKQKSSAKSASAAPGTGTAHTVSPYPILLKAAAGGGGKGMRIVRSAAEFESLFTQARSEGRSSFGDPSVYAEKYVTRPRHIEVQVLADTHGKIVHLGERECTIQRRHQKLIEEEAPRPSWTRRSAPASARWR